MTIVQILDDYRIEVTTKYPDLVFVRMSVKLAENGKYTSANPTATFTAKLSNLKQEPPGGGRPPRQARRTTHRLKR